MQDFAKPMERGQITIPQAMRVKAGITTDTWLWLGLLNNRQIVIEPVLKNKTATGSIVDVVKRFNKSKVVFWTKRDDETISKARKLSVERLKRLNWQ